MDILQSHSNPTLISPTWHTGSSGMRMFLLSTDCLFVTSPLPLEIAIYTLNALISR